MKILVTGTAGFIGFHLTKYLLEHGNEVVGIDNINNYYTVRLKYVRLAETGITKKDIEYGESVRSKKYPLYRFVKIDLVDKKLLPNLFTEEKFDCVVNLAAQAGVRYSIENPFAYAESNLLGFLNILECCRNNAIKHLVYASSSSVYGGNEKVPFSEEDNVDYPVSLYAATKKANELMASCYSKLYGLPATGLRFFTVYGPWGRPDMAPILFAKAIMNGEPIKVFNNGDLSRDFTYIDDIIEGIVRVLQKIPQKSKDDRRHVVYNIGCSSPIKLMSFIEAIENALGREAKKIFLPMQKGDVYQTFADTTKLKEDVGYNPTTKLNVGIESFIQWYKQYGYLL